MGWIRIRMLTFPSTIMMHLLYTYDPAVNECVLRRLRWWHRYDGSDYVRGVNSFVTFAHEVQQVPKRVDSAIS